MKAKPEEPVARWTLRPAQDCLSFTFWHDHSVVVLPLLQKAIPGANNECILPIIIRKRTMPELPEAETLRQPVNIIFSGKRLAHISRSPAKKLWIGHQNFPAIGLSLQSVGRQGKILVFYWGETGKEAGVCLVSRLGMSGTWLIKNRDEPLPDHSHLVLTFEGMADCLVYRDPRRFGRLEWVSEPVKSVILASQGPDILQISPDEWHQRIKSSSRTIRSILLDQKVASGVGNIYASEILFDARISPFRKGKSISRTESVLILTSAKIILESAIKSGGSTIHSFRTSFGEGGNFQIRHKVYGKAGKPCQNCHCNIKKVMENSRHLFYCSFCQKRGHSRGERKNREFLTTDPLPVS